MNGTLTSYAAVRTMPAGQAGQQPRTIRRARPATSVPRPAGVSPVLAVAEADGCPDVSVNPGAEHRSVPRRRVGGYGADLGMAQKHEEDRRHGPDDSDGARDQPYDNFEIHHDSPRPAYLPSAAYVARLAGTGYAAQARVGTWDCWHALVTTRSGNAARLMHVGGNSLGEHDVRRVAGLGGQGPGAGDQGRAPPRSAVPMSSRTRAGGTCCS